MKINKKSILYILVLILPLFLSNCSLWQKRVNLEQITINVEPGANDNSPIAIDMVAAADDETLAMLQGIQMLPPTSFCFPCSTHRAMPAAVGSLISGEHSWTMS
jgi:hypothetical protein